MRIQILQDIVDIFRGKYKKRPKRQFKTHYGIKHIYLGGSGQKVVYDELCKDKPSLICRFGATELGAVYHFLKSDKPIVKYPKVIKHQMRYNAGFYPNTDYMISCFSSEFINLCKNIDVIGVWYLQGEEEILEKYAPQANLVHLETLNPLHNNSYSEFSPMTDFRYTKYLEDKKVLVIHPFAETIEEQYKKREFLFENQNILPKFKELITLKSVQSLADNVSELGFENWFEALDSMKQKISQIDFDVAVVGCGAYGIFLADYVKSIGKKAIHIGGATQLLFGIIGSRWEDKGYEDIAQLINKYWVRPSEKDKYKGFERVEKGCYW